MLIRYSRWDGTQTIADLDTDDLLEAMADDLTSDGDVGRALRRLIQRGAQTPSGPRLPGLQDLLKQLERRRQQTLGRHDLGGALDDIKQKLEQVVQTERAGIRRQVAEARERAANGDQPGSPERILEQRAAQHQQQLDRLPRDPGGRLGELQSYDFMDPDARRLFAELLRSLRQQMLKPFMRGMQQALEGLTPADLGRLREMLQDLNRMLREKADGGDPNFGAFQAKWGQFFPGVESLDALLDQLGRQAAHMQSLLDSLSPEQRRELDAMMRAVLLKDERLDAALAQLARHLADAAPIDEWSRHYDFRGHEQVTLDEAMKLMAELAQMDELERQLRAARSPKDLEGLRPEQVEQVLGPEAARDLERLREITKRLEEAGYLERRGQRLELTARAIRKIGEKALRDVFAHLTRDRFGRHVVSHRGAGGDRTDDAKPYEFGDPFLLDLTKTVMNAVERRGGGTPIRLSADDFEVYRTELTTRAATVVMLDMSRSMLNNGYFLPAKKVALALAALLRGQFPRDRLFLVGFSLYARQFAPEQLPGLSWSEWGVGTNMHAGFILSRQLLARQAGGNRQIIMITDGEPTAHLEGAEAEFAYPPSRRTIQETLKEVQRCSREFITINTFMLEQSPWLTSFVEQVARINRGRAFFVTPERLGEYVLVDYLTGRRRSQR